MSSGMVKRTRRCLFCDDAEAKVTVEHTLSEPIRRLLPKLVGDGFDVIRLAYDQGRKISQHEHTTPVASFTRRVYCSPCNRGWMNDMDHAVAPFLAPLVAGHSASLSPTKQLAIATWATKIALVTESLMGADKVVPDVTYQWFFAERRPLRGFPITLSRYVGEEHHIYARRVLRIIDAVSGDVLGVEGVLMTITIGQYIAQSVLPSNGSGFGYDAIEGSDRIAIFPPRNGHVAWPPQRDVDAAALGEFTNIMPI